MLFFQEIAFYSEMHKLIIFISYQTLKYRAYYYYYYLCVAFVSHSINHQNCSWSTISVQNLNIFRLFRAVYLEQCDTSSILEKKIIVVGVDSSLLSHLPTPLSLTVFKQHYRKPHKNPVLGLVISLHSSAYDVIFYYAFNSLIKIYYSFLSP